MRRSSLASALLVLLVAVAAPGVGCAGEHQQLYVSQPYLELHTGPGRGYPVFHVVAREERIEILFRRTDWFKVRTARGVEGWASAADVEKTVTSEGTALTFGAGDRVSYEDHSIEAGILAGKFGGSTVISGFAAYSLNTQIGAELAIGQALGRFNDAVTADLGLVYYPVPEWRLSPFVMAGGGVVHNQPRPNNPNPDTRTDPSAYLGAGLRYYLTQRFFLRAEYKGHFIFKRNEEVDEWKAGFAFFY